MSRVTFAILLAVLACGAHPSCCYYIDHLLPQESSPARNEGAAGQMTLADICRIIEIGSWPGLSLNVESEECRAMIINGLKRMQARDPPMAFYNSMAKKSDFQDIMRLGKREFQNQGRSSAASEEDKRAHDGSFSDQLRLGKRASSGLDGTLRLGKRAPSGLDGTLRLGKRAPSGLDGTLRLGKRAPSGLDGTLRLGKRSPSGLDGTLRLGKRTQGGLDGTLRLGKRTPSGLDGTLRLGKRAPSGLDGTLRLGKRTQGGLDGTLRLGKRAPSGLDGTLRLGKRVALWDHLVRLFRRSDRPQLVGVMGAQRPLLNTVMRLG